MKQEQDNGFNLLDMLSKAKSDIVACFTNFTKGLINSITVDKMPEGSLRVAKDIAFYEEGAISVPLEPEDIGDLGSASYLYFAFCALNSGSGVRYYRHVRTGSTSSLVYYSSNLSSWSSATSLSSSFDWDTVSWAPAQVEAAGNYYLFYAQTGGTGKLLAGVRTNIGCSQATSGPGVSLTAGAGLTEGGLYTYVTVYYEDDTGDMSTESGESSITTTSGNCRVTVTWNTSQGGSNADYVKIYRSVANGGSLYYVTSALKSAGTYTDACPDTGLGAYLSSTSVGTPPDDASILGSYLGRVWYMGFPHDSGDCNKVFYSLNLKPGTVPTSYYIIVGNKEIPITGFATTLSSALIFNRETIFYLEGSSANTFKATETGSQVGTTATHTIVNSAYGVFFLANDGVYCFTESGVAKISTQIDWIFNDVGDTTIGSYTMHKPYLYRCKAAIWRDQYWLMIWVDGGASRTVLVYDIKNKRWRERTQDMTCFHTDTINDRLLAGTQYGGTYKMHSIEATTAGLTDTMAVDIRTGQVNVGDLQWFERYRFDGLGTWEIQIWVDGIQQHTETITSSTRILSNMLRAITADSRGRRVWCRFTPTSPRPLTHKIYGLELIGDQ